jgi:PAS domain S-box-containing protein
MNNLYTYDPHLWPALLSLALAVFLGYYSWSRRKMPGATAFAFACLFGALWALGTILEISATDFSTRIFWIKFQTIWQLPSATAIFCFVLVYARLGGWLTRRNLALLAIPPFIALALVLTNDYYHLIWTGFQMEEFILKIPGAANRPLVIYAQLLAVVNVGVLVWLAIRSPRHRWPVAIMLFGQITGRVLFMLNNLIIDFLDPGEAVLLVVGLLCGTYAFALFRFHVFDPVPLARSTVIEQMTEGMLVLDLDGRIVDLNPAAEKILGEPQTELRGRPAAAILSLRHDQLVQPIKTGGLPTEITLGDKSAPRYYSLSLTSLVDHRGSILGWLLLLHDETERKGAQTQIVEQQRVMAALRERELLARELHDGIGQVLGFVGLQVQTVRKWLSEGNIEKAEPLLVRLTEVAKDTHADIRESILNLKTGAVSDWSFFPVLRQYLDSYKAYYDIHSEIFLPEGCTDIKFDPVAGIQILRVIQEALTNARKHSGARNVKVVFEMTDQRVFITISDDGRGFNSNQLKPEAGHFGLVFMRERMDQIGGSLVIDSQPGAGTTIKLEAPTAIRTEEIS